MNKYIFLLFCSLFLSCEDVLDQIIENSIKEDPELTVIVKNDTPYSFKRTEIITKNGEKVVFQIIDSGSYGISDLFNFIYDEIEINIQTESKYFSYKPKYYKENFKVFDGRYTFKVSISDTDKSKLVIKRVKN